MDISIYLEPINKLDFTDNNPKKLGNNIIAFTNKNSFPDLNNVDIAIIGVKEDRRALNNKGCGNAPDIVRYYIYNLYTGLWKTKIVDLGNLILGHEVEDTYYALKSCLTDLISSNVLPIIIGGSQDLTLANYLAYENLGQIINFVSIDSKFNLGETHLPTNSENYLSKIITQKPSYLFNYTNIGYQTYFTDQEAIELLKNLFFDACRLGAIRENIENAEPMVRNADMLSVDISSVRYSDAPGNANASPNGFYGEEICQIMRYAGLSDKLTSLGIYEINPSLDNKGITSHLVAQMIWYFIDGFANRKNIIPQRDKTNFIKYLVTIKNQYEIVFYKSNITGQWWMEIPCPTEIINKYERHYMVPCSYKDYQIATNDDIPDRWWMMYQKLI